MAAKVGSLMVDVGANVARMQRDMGQITKKIDHASRSWQKSVNRQTKKMDRAFKALGATVAAVFTVRAIKQVGQSFIDTAAKAEKAEVLLGRLYGTAADGKRVFSELLRQDYTKLFGFDATLKAAVKLKAVGLDPLEGSLQTISDALSAYGNANALALDRTTVAISQMVGKGVVSMEELRQQLAEQIPEAAKLMAKGLGMSMADFMEVVSKGAVDAKTGITAMFNEMNKKFSGATADMMTTWSGMTAQLENWWKIFQLRTMREGGVFDYLKGQLKDVLAWLEEAERSGKLTEWAKQLGEGVKDAFVSIKGWLDSAQGWWADHGESVKTFASVAVKAIGLVVDIVSAMAKAIGAVISGLDKLLGTISSTLPKATAASGGAPVTNAAMSAFWQNQRQQQQLQQQQQAPGLLQALQQMWGVDPLAKKTGNTLAASGRLINNFAAQATKPVGSGSALPSGMTKADYAEEGRQIQKLRDFESMMARMGMTDKQREIADLKKKYDKHYADLEDLVAGNYELVDHYDEMKAKIHKGYLADMADMDKGWFQTLVESWQDTNSIIQAGTEQTAQSIQSSWANTISGMLTGDSSVNSFGEFWRSMLDGMIQAFANFIAQILAKWAMSGVATLFASLFDFGGAGGGGGGKNLAGSVGTSVAGGVVGKWFMSTAAGKAVSSWFSSGAGPAANVAAKGLTNVAATAAAPTLAYGAIEGGKAAMMGPGMLNVAGGGGGAASAGWSGMSLAGGASMAGLGGVVGGVMIGGMIMDKLLADTRFTPEEAEKFFENMPEHIGHYNEMLAATVYEHDTLSSALDKSGLESFIRDVRQAGGVLGHTTEEMDAYLETLGLLPEGMLETYQAGEDMNAMLQQMGVDVGNLGTQSAQTTDQLMQLTNTFKDGGSTAERFAAAADDVANSVLGMTDTINGMNFNEFMDQLDLVGDSLGQVNNQATNTGTTFEQWSTNGGQSGNYGSQYYHQGGQIMHTGGMVGEALAKGWITAHGGMSFGLKPDEVPVIAQRGEFMWSKADVDRWGGPGNVDRLRKQTPGGGGTTVVIDSPTVIINTETLDEETIDRMMPYLFEQMAQYARSEYGA